MIKSIPNRPEELHLLRERAENLSRLMDVTALITSLLDLNEVMKRVMALAKEIMGAEAASIMIWNEESEFLEFRTSVGDVGMEKLKTIRIPKGKGIAGTVVETGEPVLVADVSKDNRFFSGTDEETGFVTKSILAAPLVVHDRILGVGEVLNHKDGRPFSELDLELFASFCRQVAVAIENARLHEAEVKRHLLDQQMKMAASIQKNFLPPSLPEDEAGRFEVRAFTKSAQEVGGDLYCVTMLAHGRLGLCIGDVSGKGIPAALYMARVVSEFRLLCSTGAQTHEVLTALNQGFVSGSMQGMFVTFVYAILDPESGQLRVTNAGHPPLLLSSAAGTPRWVGSASGPPLGILPSARYEEETIVLAPEDSLLFYSDGIVEARNKEGGLYGQERLRDVAVRAPRGANGLLSEVLDSAQNFTQDTPQADDMTLVSVSWGGLSA